MKKTEHKTTAFRQLIAKGAVMLPGVANAAMARQVEQALGRPAHEVPALHL